MGKKTPKPPAPIDYTAAATAQGQANLASALQTSYLSNPNIVNPYGSSTTTFGEARDASGNVIPNATQATVRQELNPASAAALASQQEVEKQLAALALQGAGVATRQLGTPFSYDPSRSFLNTAGAQAQTYTPSGALGALNYGPRAGEYGMAAGINADDYGRAASINADAYGKAASIDAGAYNAAGIDANAYGRAGGINAGDYGQATGQLDLSNVARMPVNAGMTGQNAILSRLAPQIQQSEAATAQRLANQGITQGSEAYRNAMRNQGQQFNDLYTQAALQGINLDIGANQQGYGQALSSAGLYNQAIAQNYGQGLSAQQLSNQAIGQNFGQGLSAQQIANQAAGQNFGQNLSAQELANASIAQNFGQGITAQELANRSIAQNFGQGVTAQQLANAAIGQNYGQAAASAGFQNAAQAQAANQQMAQESANREAQNQIFNQQMSSANFQNAARQNDLQMQLGLYNQPLNQVNALMAGSQIQNPTFQAYTGANVNAAPVFQASQQTGQDAQQAYAQRVGAYNAGMGALGQIGGLAAQAAISDIRLKSKIVRVDTHPLGIGIYEYDIDGRRERGVIAQEVERVLPSAVIEHPDGYKMVDYGAL